MNSLTTIPNLTWLRRVLWWSDKATFCRCNHRHRVFLRDPENVDGFILRKRGHTCQNMGYMMHWIPSDPGDQTQDSKCKIFLFFFHYIQIPFYNTCKKYTCSHINTVYTPLFCPSAHCIAPTPSVQIVVVLFLFWPSNAWGVTPNSTLKNHSLWAWGSIWDAKDQACGSSTCKANAFPAMLLLQPETKSFKIVDLTNIEKTWVGYIFFVRIAVTKSSFLSFIEYFLLLVFKIKCIFLF